jgi:hypothetical protein
MVTAGRKIMSKAWKWSSVAGLALVLACTGLISAQQKAAQPGAAKAAPEVQQFRAKQILGARVNLEGNTAGGTVDDIVLDENGNVDYLIVVNDNQKLVTVPWDATQFNVDKRMAVVNITPQKWQQAPTYTVDHYPVFSAPAYRTQVYSYYGLTPHQQRRMMRRGAVVVP